MVINHKTVFILGAGASSPYRYPTGIELKWTICHNFNCLAIAECLFQEQDERIDCEKRAEEFKKFFLRSSQNSIDRFLKDNNEYADIGKQIIAFILYPLEAEAHLTDTKGIKNWYNFFWNMVDNKFENINKHNVHFITFNYDRSFEQFLFQSLYNSYSGKKTQEECAQIINKMDVIHVYGSLAPLPWQDKTKGRPYSKGKASKTDLLEAMKSIFLLGEERVFTEQQQRIQKIMSEAKYIYFLGFGYDEENVKILGEDFGHAVKVWGTSLELGGFKKRNADEIIRRKKIWKPKAIKFYDIDCYDFLKEEVVLK